MRGRIAGGAPKAHAKGRAALVIIAAAAVPTLVAGQSVAAVAATAAPAARSAAQQPMTAALAAKLSKNVNQHVIVIMKSQLAAAKVGSHAALMRSNVIAVKQAPLMSELRQVHATHIKPYRLVNSFAATVSKGEVARLKANPAVAKVIPDVTIHGGAPEQAPALGSTTKKTAKAPRKSSAATSLTPNVIPGACAPAAGAARSRGARADAYRLRQPACADRPLAGHHRRRREGRLDRGRLDPNNVNFIRPDGKSVFDPSVGGDYQDFTGDGPGQITGGDEAFLDANSIAGQGIHVYNVQNFSAPAVSDGMQRPDRGRGARRLAWSG